MDRVVVFGAGLVVRAHVRYLLDHGFKVTLASRTVAKAEAILAGHPNGTAMAYDVDRDPGRLRGIIANHDVAVSLLPWNYHVQVARACLDAGRHLVTTSYIREPMKALDAEARAKGVILLNEMGVDPGIDHMTAMQVILRVKAGGGTITTFQSYCGGLPAPEANDNPFGYKFSWSPRGVLLAGLNSARFRCEGHMWEIPGEQLFDRTWPVEVDVEGRTIEFEGYPNRDSMPYVEYYGVDPQEEMFRGTLRNVGWCRIMKQVARLGMLRTDELEGVERGTFADLVARLVGRPAVGDLRGATARHLGIAEDGPEIAAMDWLGLFGRDPLPGPRAPVDILTARMLAKMSYNPGERDMLVLRHTFIAEYPDRKERIRSTMIDFGIPGGDSSMNRTVGLPAAVGARFILEGKLTQPGVLVPVMPDFFEPALEELGRLGIHFTEESEQIG